MSRNGKKKTLFSIYIYNYLSYIFFLSVWKEKKNSLSLCTRVSSLSLLSLSLLTMDDDDLYSKARFFCE
jgi:hypothetical protein